MELWRRKSTKGFIQLLGGNALTSLSQGVQFFVLARALGPTEFGRIAATMGVMQLLMPFSGMGASNVMIMRAARNPAVLPLYLGNALVILLGTASLLVAIATFLVTPALNGQVPVLVMALLGISELFATRTLDVCWQVFVAREEFRYTSMFLSVQSLTRLVTACVFVFMTTSPLAVQWAWWALASNLVTTAWALVITLRIVGGVRVDLALASKELGVGAAFALGQSARGFYTDADKMFLARYTSATIVGQYTMAFRVVQIALTVIRALSTGLQARFYRAGEEGLGATVTLMNKILRPTIVGAIVLAAVFYVSAPLATLVAGEAYAVSVDMLRTMCLMPLATVVPVLLLDALWASSHQRAAAIIQIISAIVVCALCVLLIPRVGWGGAVVASYASQVLLGGLCAYLLYRRRAPPAKPTIERTGPSSGAAASNAD